MSPDDCNIAGLRRGVVQRNILLHRQPGSVGVAIGSRRDVLPGMAARNGMLNHAERRRHSSCRVSLSKLHRRAQSTTLAELKDRASAPYHGCRRPTAGDETATKGVVVCRLAAPSSRDLGFDREYRRPALTRRHSNGTRWSGEADIEVIDEEVALQRVVDGMSLGFGNKQGNKCRSWPSCHVAQA